MDVCLLEGEGPGLPLLLLVPDLPLVLLRQAPVRGVTRQAGVGQHQGRAHGGDGDGTPLSPETDTDMHFSSNECQYD